MRKLKIYQVDAFTDKLFMGNPAAVCILDEWLSDELMQSIGNENNLAETAFVVPKDNDFLIRWFTTTVEVDLCGHATLASAYVLFNLLGFEGSVIRFHSVNSGLLSVSRKDDMLFLDFPTDVLNPINEDKNAIERCIGIEPMEVFRGKTDYVAIIDSEDSLRGIKPDFEKISKLSGRGLIVTAKGAEVDFVSRFFAPQSGINEDPVTGSAHTSLLPIWSEKTGKNKLKAKQLSKRGGELYCELKDNRCFIGGYARLYLTGEIYLD